MTRKPRRSKKPDKPESDNPAEPRPAKDRELGEPTDADQLDPESEVDAQAADDAEAEEATEEKPARLPAYGFAADLLAAGKPTKTSQAGGGEQDDTVDPPTARGKGITAGSDRIFRFADSLEREDEEETEVAQRITTWITFGLADEIFALPVEPVREVLRISHITRVPHAPRPIRGVTNLRGRVIPIIDLRVRIELPPAEIDRSTRAIVVGSRGRLIGLMVDAVHQVVHIDLNVVQPPPDDVMTVQSDYLSGVYQQESRLILLLDVDRALVIRESEEMETEAGVA